uniref:Uncharacterized protein n=1 Tax=Caenorhabditis japonica TaxID=281687 RepID=A0A8R1EIT7_CAEJA
MLPAANKSTPRESSSRVSRVAQAVTQVVGDNAKTDPKRMGRGMDPYMIRYRSTRPRGGSVDCFGVGRRGSTPARAKMEYIWRARGSVGEWKHIGSYMVPRVPRGGHVEIFSRYGE